MDFQRMVAMAFATAVAASADGGIIFTAWNFNGPQGTSNPSIGMGVALAVGGTSANFAAGDPADSGAPTTAENKGWNIASFAAQGSQSGERGVQFSASTHGYDSIAITWHERHSNSASRFVQCQYTVDGTVFTSAGIPNDGIFEAVLGGEVWQSERRVELKGVAGVSGNAKFAVRIVSIFGPGSTQFVPTSPTASYSASGTIRFDLVNIEGVAVPSPAVLALGASGAILASRTRRRAN